MTASSPVGRRGTEGTLSRKPSDLTLHVVSLRLSQVSKVK